jgi:superfamily II RNA helicase
MRVRNVLKKGHALLPVHGPGRHHRRRGPDVGRLILQFQARHWLPAIYFIFSRAGCEAALRRCLRDGIRFIFSGVLDRLTPPELAALLSCLSEQSREGDSPYSWALLKQHPHLQKRLQAMGRLAQELHDVQRAHQVTLPVSVQVGYLATSYRWTSSEEDWARVVRDSYGGHEGDLIRAFRRLIDLCRQLAESPEVKRSLQERLWQAVSDLDRDIVFENAFI